MKMSAKLMLDDHICWETEAADVCSVRPGEVILRITPGEEFQNSLRLHAQSSTSVRNASHDQNFRDRSYFTRQKCEWETDTTGWVTKGPKIQMQKSSWMWSQALLRWGDSTSPNRIFTLLILWHIVISCSPTSLVNFHFWWMADVVCEQQDLFFPAPRFPPRPEWESMKRFTCCRVAGYVTC